MQVVLLLKCVSSILDLPLLSIYSDWSLEGGSQTSSRAGCASALQMASQAALQAVSAASASGMRCDDHGNREVPRPHRW